MHPCGVVLSRDPITALTPTFTSAKGYATTHFEMEAVETVGLVKMDILAQGGLAVIRDTLALLAERGITPDLENLEPWEDAKIWQMIATGNARGVHHIESPAMVSLARMCGVRDIKSITVALLERYQIERARAPFASLQDFYERTRPTGAEMLNLIRAGAFDGFGEPRTAQFWHLKHIAQWPHAQGYLFQNDQRVRLPEVPLTEPDHAQRLRDETELLSFTVSGHPLEQFPMSPGTPIVPSATSPATPANACPFAASSSPTAPTIKSPATR
jgi:DNA polymerase III alpha subunit